MIRPVAKLGFAIAALVVVLAIGGWLLRDAIVRSFAPDPTTIVSSSLQGLREQNRLSPFAARYVAVVTTEQRRLGLSARRTMIMPGEVRYEIDLAKLGDDDLDWDEATDTLTVTLPPVEIAGPQVDLAGIRQYDGGGLLLRVTSAGDVLDAANRRAGQAELLAQARAPTPMRLARDAGRRAVEQSFALPLRAAGLDARVVARYADEPREVYTPPDRSARVEDVLANGAR